MDKKNKDIILKGLSVVDTAIHVSDGIADFIGNFVAYGIEAVLGHEFKREKKDTE